MPFKPDPGARPDIDKVTTELELPIPVPEPAAGADIIAIWEEAYEKIDNDSISKGNEIAAKVSTSDIVDNLTSTDTDKPLSANQGKILNEKIGVPANINLHNETTDPLTMQDNASAYEDLRRDNISGKNYICINKAGSAAVPSPTSDFEQTDIHDNRKRIEKLFEEITSVVSGSKVQQVESFIRNNATNVTELIIRLEVVNGDQVIPISSPFFSGKQVLWAAGTGLTGAGNRSELEYVSTDRGTGSYINFGVYSEVAGTGSILISVKMK